MVPRVLSTWMVLAACTAGDERRERGGGATDSDAPAVVACSDTPATDPTSSDTAPATTSDLDVVGFPYAAYDCAQGVPAPPLEHRVLAGTDSAEDIAFDLDGYMLRGEGMGGNVYRMTYDGVSAVMATGMGDPTGIEVLPSRDVVIADRSNGRIVRWSYLTGGQDLLATNLPWPNGIEVAPDGSLFVTDTPSEAVYRVDPASGDMHEVATGIPGADGLTFDPTYHTLYVGSIETGDLYTVAVTAPGAYGPAALWIDGDAAPWELIDGLQVDRCGNVYVADYGGALWRVDPSGVQVDLLYEGPAEPVQGMFLQIPAIRFGSGVLQWDPYKLYLSTYQELIEVDVGVPNKARWPAHWP